jgi:hypothetical protein
MLFLKYTMVTNLPQGTCFPALSPITAHMGNILPSKLEQTDKVLTTMVNARAFMNAMLSPATQVTELINIY